MSIKNIMPELENQLSLTCQLDALKRYLKLKNWSLLRSNETTLVYEGPADDANHPMRLILPAHREFEDTPAMISKAIKLLSTIVQCPIDSMCQMIMNSGCDFLRPRILTPSNTWNISLDVGKRVIDDFYGLIYDAACLEEDPQPFFAKRRNIGKKYAERCRLGQTFAGSYGFSIEMPLSPSSPETIAQIPFERRVMIRIARGLLAIRKSSQEADVSVLTNDYKQGFNANLYEIMQGLMQSLQDHQIEFTFAWSPEYLLPQELVNMTAVRLVPASVLPFLESATRSLRRSSESQDTVVKGKIVRLHGDGKIGEEELDDLESSSNDRGMIVIEWETEKGKPRLIRAELSQEDYRLACDAHKDGKIISIRGKPEKPGKYLILTSSTDFRVLDD